MKAKPQNWTKTEVDEAKTQAQKNLIKAKSIEKHNIYEIIPIFRGAKYKLIKQIPE